MRLYCTAVQDAEAGYPASLWKFSQPVVYPLAIVKQAAKEKTNQPTTSMSAPILQSYGCTDTWTGT
jgi:hypothetical protein